MFEIIISSVAALIAGYVDAIVGGGGVIVFPALLFFNLPVPIIVGTNKMVSTFGTAMASYTFWKHGKVTKEIARMAIPFTAAGALLGAYTVLHVPNTFLKPFAGLFLLILAIYFFFKPQIGTENNFQGMTKKIALTIVISVFMIGFYDGFFGPGTGMFLTFLFVRFIKLDFVRAAANTKILNLVSNSVSLVYFLWMGNISFKHGVPMALANILGGHLGARSAINAGSGLIRWIFIFMAILLALKMANDYFPLA
jgi:uncharacterized membrane protein YfcA